MASQRTCLSYSKGKKDKWVVSFTPGGLVNEIVHPHNVDLAGFWLYAVFPRVVMTDYYRLWANEAWIFSDVCVKHTYKLFAV